MMQSPVWPCLSFHLLTYSMEQSPSWEANQWTLRLVKKFPAFMELESPSPYPQVGFFYLQRKHLNLWVILNMCFIQRGVVSTSSNPQARGPPLVGCPRLLIQFIHTYPPYRRPFLHPQPEDAPCRSDMDPHSWMPFLFLASVLSGLVQSAVWLVLLHADVLTAIHSLP
jgi:hypothetical protein